MDKHIETRANTTGCLWIVLIAGVFLMTDSLVDVLQGGVVGVIFLMLLTGIIISGFIWNWGRLGGVAQERISATEKLKQDRLSRALQNLSDDQLHRLKERIASGAITESELSYFLGDESELMDKPKR